MVRLLLQLPGIGKSHADIWGLTPIAESQRRQYDTISLLLEGREAPDPPVPVVYWRDLSGYNKATIMACLNVCFVCPKTLSIGRERSFKCGDLKFCEFCPPKGERLCPVCGNYLTEGIYSEGKSSEDEG